MKENEDANENVNNSEPLDGNILHIAISSNEQNIYAYTDNSTLYLFKTNSVNTAEFSPAAKLFEAPDQIPTDDPVVSLAPRPKHSDELLLLTQSGKALIFNAKKLSLISSSATAISWSHLGTTLIVAQEGKLVQYQPDGTIIATYNFPENIKSVISLTFVSNTNVIVSSISEDDGDVEYTYSNVSLDDKSKSSDWASTTEACPPYGDIDRYPCWYTCTLRNWASSYSKVFILASAQSDSLAISTESELFDSSEDSARAVFPLRDDGDSSPVGFSLDITSKIAIKEAFQGIEEQSTLPAVWMMDSFGYVIAWNVVFAEGIKKGAIDLNETIRDYKNVVLQDSSEPVKESDFENAQVEAAADGISEETTELPDDDLNSDTQELEENLDFGLENIDFGKNEISDNSKASNIFGAFDSNNAQEDVSTSSSQLNDNKSRDSGLDSLGSTLTIGSKTEPQSQENPFGMNSKSNESKTPFGGQTSISSAFTSTKTTTNSDNAGSAFGKPGFGSSNSSGFSAPAFGQTSTNSNTSAFGSHGFGSTAFGNQQSSTSSNSTGFGSHGFGASAFGNQQSSTSTTFGSHGFGSSTFGNQQSALTSSTNSSAFGSHGFGSSTFGSQQPSLNSTSTPSAFGSSNGSLGSTGSTGVFSAYSQKPSTSSTESKSDNNTLKSSSTNAFLSGTSNTESPLAKLASGKSSESIFASSSSSSPFGSKGFGSQSSQTTIFPASKQPVDSTSNSFSFGKQSSSLNFGKTGFSNVNKFGGSNSLISGNEKSRIKSLSESESEAESNSESESDRETTSPFGKPAFGEASNTIKSNEVKSDKTSFTATNKFEYTKPMAKGFGDISAKAQNDSGKSLFGSSKMDANLNSSRYAEDSEDEASAKKETVEEDPSLKHKEASGFFDREKAEKSDGTKGSWDTFSDKEGSADFSGSSGSGELINAPIISPDYDVVTKNLKTPDSKPLDGKLDIPLLPKQQSFDSSEKNSLSDNKSNNSETKNPEPIDSKSTLNKEYKADSDDDENLSDISEVFVRAYIKRKKGIKLEKEEQESYEEHEQIKSETIDTSVQFPGSKEIASPTLSDYYYGTDEELGQEDENIEQESGFIREGLSNSIPLFVSLDSLDVEPKEETHASEAVSIFKEVNGLLDITNYNYKAMAKFIELNRPREDENGVVILESPKTKDDIIYTDKWKLSDADDISEILKPLQSKIAEIQKSLDIDVDSSILQDLSRSDAQLAKVRSMLEAHEDALTATMGPLPPRAVLLQRQIRRTHAAVKSCVTQVEKAVMEIKADKLNQPVSLRGVQQAIRRLTTMAVNRNTLVDQLTRRVQGIRLNGPEDTSSGSLAIADTSYISSPFVSFLEQTSVAGNKSAVPKIHQKLEARKRFATMLANRDATETVKKVIPIVKQ